MRVDGCPQSACRCAFLAVRAAARHVPTAVVTSSNRETLVLVCEQLALRDCVTVTVAAEDCTRSKPSPEPYLMAAERLGVNPSRCLVFEDSAAGIAAAQAAGATAIAIGPQSGHVPWLTDYRDLPDRFFACATDATDG